MRWRLIAVLVLDMLLVPPVVFLMPLAMAAGIHAYVYAAVTHAPIVFLSTLALAQCIERMTIRDGEPMIRRRPHAVSPDTKVEYKADGRA